jgi:hypothetical protein
MVASGDQDGVDFGPAQQLAKVPIERAILVSVVFISHPLNLLTPAALHLTNRYELHILFWQHHTEVVLAVWTKSDSGKNDPLTRGDTAISAQDTARNDHWCRQACSSEKSAFEEITPGKELSMPGCFHAHALEDRSQNERLRTKDKFYCGTACIAKYHSRPHRQT